MAAPIFSGDTASSLLCDACGIAVVALPCLTEKSLSRPATLPRNSTLVAQSPV